MLDRWGGGLSRRLRSSTRQGLPCASRMPVKLQVVDLESGGWGRNCPKTHRFPGIRCPVLRTNQAYSASTPPLPFTTRLVSVLVSVQILGSRLERKECAPFGMAEGQSADNPPGARPRCLPRQTIPPENPQAAGKLRSRAHEIAGTEGHTPAPLVAHQLQRAAGDPPKDRSAHSFTLSPGPTPGSSDTVLTQISGLPAGQ